MFLGADDVEYLPPQQLRSSRPQGQLRAGLIAWPDDLLQAAQQTNDYVHGMAQAADAFTHWTTKTPKGSGDQFRAFLNEWQSFYDSVFSNRFRTAAHLLSGIGGQLRDFQTRTLEWAKKLKSWGVAVPGVAPTIKGGTNVLMWIGVGTVALAALFVIGKLVHKVTLGNALTEAEDEAMRIVNEKRRRRQDKTAFSIT